VSFWFATGGAGVCLSRGMALKMVPYAAYVSRFTRLFPDCYVVFQKNFLLTSDMILNAAKRQSAICQKISGEQH